MKTRGATTYVHMFDCACPVAVAPCSAATQHRQRTMNEVPFAPKPSPTKQCTWTLPSPKVLSDSKITISGTVHYKTPPIHAYPSILTPFLPRPHRHPPSHTIAARTQATMPRSDEAEAFFWGVYAAVQEIPHGRVTTYGHIAALIGMRECHRGRIYALIHHLTSERGEMNSPTPQTGRHLPQTPPRSGQHDRRNRHALPQRERALAESHQRQRHHLP